MWEVACELTTGRGLAEGELEIRMSGTTDSAPDVGEPLITRPVPSKPAPAHGGRGLAWLAAAGIVSSTLIMLAACAVRNSWEHPFVVLPATGPPWALSLRVSPVLVTWAMWGTALLAGGSVVVGLAALGGGARQPVRLLLAVGLAAAAVFTVLPPTGSTDALDYAAYGRIVVLGHSPYVMTPAQLFRAGDPIGRDVSRVWREHVTSYGPLATAEQWAAASLGGTSAARIVFWLKLWNAIAFGAVVLALDRMLRSDPSRRARAHLLWTANPLLLWILVAAGHLDLLAAAFGFFGVITLRKRGPADEPGALRGLAAGLLVGVAADLKITYILAGLAFAALAGLMLWRLPDGGLAWPAVRPALAVSAAWLFVWPYQLPWYDAMLICLLVLYPASRLDWLVVARVTAGTFALMPGNAGFPPQHLLKVITSDSLFYVAPAVLLPAAGAPGGLGPVRPWKHGPAPPPAPPPASLTP